MSGLQLVCNPPVSWSRRRRRE